MDNEERNPFPFGRELGPAELIDRQPELDQIERTIRNRGKLFVLGPRRFGKTSLLAAAEERARGEGVIVLRFDAEKYENLGSLAQALLTAAVRALERPVDRIAKLIGQVAGKLRPELTVDPNTGSVSVSLGVAAGTAELPILADALDAIEQLAVEADREVSVMLDEIQQIVVEHGLPAEKQLRATVQKHAKVSYIFAGSSTRLLTAMTSDANRPFYRLGGRLFIDRLPRGELVPFLAAGLSRRAASVQETAYDRILKQADEVPYNVQRLAYEVWERLRSGADRELNDVTVDRAVDDIVKREDPAYTQLWTSLKKNQKKALRALIGTGGEEMFSSAVSGEYGLSASSMQRALEVLEERHLIRPAGDSRAPRFSLVDPFVAAWLRAAQGS